MEIKPKANCPLNSFEPCKELDSTTSPLEEVRREPRPRKLGRTACGQTLEQLNVRGHGRRKTFAAWDMA